MPEESVSRTYTNDHERLHRLFEQFQSVKGTEPDRARRCFQNFKAGLERHIIWEESLLFPLFEAKTGIRDSGPTAVMRFEHEQIRRMLELIDATLADGRPAQAVEESRLLALLDAHNWKEEAILYPMIDEHITAEERDQLFRSMAPGE